MDGTKKKLRVISKRALREYWEGYAQAQASLEKWRDVISSRTWGNLADFKKHFSRSVDYVRMTILSLTLETIFNLLP